MGRAGGRKLLRCGPTALVVTTSQLWTATELGLNAEDYFSTAGGE